MLIAVAGETDADEPRVAATPETVKKLKAQGTEVVVQAGAGQRAGLPDAAFAAAGAEIREGDAALAGAEVLLAVRRPSPERARSLKEGAIVVALMDPYGHEDALRALAETGITAFGMELLPRITRAQTMDELSSQANLAGYRSVIDAAAAFGRALPMMMTAAGTVPAARVFVMGAGVAGLQAIATARRLGAIVTATDVRPAAKEQVESLGAKFVAVEDEEFREAETAGGYAREMSADYQKKQAELVAAHIARQDIVVTTALIPGRPAPRLVSRAMLETMRPGSIVVDLAVERGGNVEGVVAGQAAQVGPVTVLGYANVAGRLAATASALYAKNLAAFLEPMLGKGTLAVDWDDEIVKATLLTRGGRVVHPAFAPKGEGGA
jgi:NAD(P) transhydrogenase subunit alpha